MNYFIYFTSNGSLLAVCLAVNTPSVVSLDSSIKSQGNFNDKMFLGTYSKAFLEV